MSTQETTVVTISSDEDTDALIARLPSLADEQIQIRVDDRCNTLLTAAEFHRVLMAAKQHRVGLAIATDDQLRQELARMLGWTVVERPATPFPSNGPDVSEGPDDAERSETATTWQPPVSFRDRTTADLATYRPTNPPRRTRAPAASASDVTRPMSPGPAGSRTQSQAASKPTVRASATAAPRVSSEPKHPRRRRALIALAVAIPLLVLAAAAAMVVVMLPTASVSLVPTERAIAADFTYGLAAPDKSFDLTIRPWALSNTSSFEKTIPTTGERFVPDGTAGGTLIFSNPTTKAVVVPSGTTFKAATGVNYVTQSAVTVPAADPFGAQTLGTASVKVVAAKAGPDGNLEAGTLIGQLDSGLYFTHREAFAGGTLKRIPVVSESDLAALRAEAESALAASLEPEFRSKVTAGMEIVPGSLASTPPIFEFSREAGADGAEVSIKAAQTISAQIFEPGKFIADAKEEVGRRLAAQAGSDVILLGDRVTVGEPVPLPGGTSFTVHAEGVVRSVVTDDERAELRQRLTGKSVQDAEEAIRSLPNVTQFTLVTEPDWLPRRMPLLADRIEVTVATDTSPLPRP